MALLKPFLNRLLDSGSEIYECRDCGTSLDSDGETCPECGSEATAYYDLK